MMNSKAGGIVGSGSESSSVETENRMEVDPVDDSNMNFTKGDDDVMGQPALCCRLIPHPMGKLMRCPVCGEKFYGFKYLNAHLICVHLNKLCGSWDRNLPRPEPGRRNEETAPDVKIEEEPSDNIETENDVENSDANFTTRTLRKSTRENTRASRPMLAEPMTVKKSKKKRLQLPVAEYRTKGQYLYAMHAQMFSKENDGEVSSNNESCSSEVSA